MKKKQLIALWSLVTGILIALFWGTYYFIVGDVPIITSIKMTPNWIIDLPFEVSRWWDVLIGPIWSMITILLLTNKKLKEKLKNEEDLLTCPGGGSLLLLFVVLMAGLYLGFSDYPILGLILDWTFCLIFSLIFGLYTNLSAGLSVGLILGLIFGPILSLILGLITGMIFVGVFGLIFGLIVLITK